MKSAYAVLIGRPSSGKSTLINALCKNKVSIVSPVPQTTRNRIRGIYTDERGQLVILDTPGYHASTRKFNLKLKTILGEALAEVDMVLYVLDATRMIGGEEEQIMEILRPLREKTVVVLNKTDMESPCTALIEERLKREFPSSPLLRVSALKKTGIENLFSALFSLAPEGDILYPEEYYTDQHPEFRIAEIIREKAILGTKEEVPHALFVEIADMEEREGGSALWVRAFIHVERESQKGILIGKQGEKIRAIRTLAQEELQDIFPYRIFLDIRVKVTPKWRNNDKLIEKLVY